MCAAIAAIGAGLSLSVEWVSDPGHVLLSERGVSMSVGGSVAILLVTIVLIESLAERSHHPGGIIAKLGGASLAVTAALLAPVVTVPGGVLIVGSALAALVISGAALQDQLHARAEGT